MKRFELCKYLTTQWNWNSFSGMKDMRNKAINSKWRFVLCCQGWLALIGQSRVLLSCMAHRGKKDDCVCKLASRVKFEYSPLKGWREVSQDGRQPFLLHTFFQNVESPNWLHSSSLRISSSLSSLKMSATFASFWATYLKMSVSSEQSTNISNTWTKKQKWMNSSYLE